MTDYKKLCEDLRFHAEYSEDGDYIDLFPYVEGFEELIAENDRLKKRLDAAVADLRKLAHEHCTCYACINDKFDYDKSVCVGCQYNNWNNWQWHGMEDAE